MREERRIGFVGSMLEIGSSGRETVVFWAKKAD